MLKFTGALAATVALLLQKSSPTDVQRSVTLTSNVSFDVDPLCPGSTVQFTCIALDFPTIDWVKNGTTLKQYTPTSTVSVTEMVSQISVVLWDITVRSAFSADFITTLTAIVNEGLSVGDNITCGNQLLDIAYLIANHKTVSLPPAPPLNSNTLVIESGSSNSVRLTINFDTAFSRDNQVNSYCIRSQSGACPDNMCVSPNNSYNCDGLEAGAEYSFAIRAINCGDQEGQETSVFSIIPKVPSAPPSCEVYAVYNQSTGTLSGITALWIQVESPPNITSFMTQDILFYNISITGSSSPEVKVTAGREVCSSNGMCNHTIRDNRLTEPRYNVKVAASNIIGIGQPVTCQGQIDYNNFVFAVSTSAPMFVGDDTTVRCQFQNSLGSPNHTRQCQLCYSTLADRLTFENCQIRTLTQDNMMALFKVQFPSSSGGSYGPFFYQVLAREETVTLAVLEGHVYTGCSPLQLGSISTPEVNSRCSSLLNDGSQLVEGIQRDNIIFCYSSEATLQGAVAMTYCDKGFERVGPEMVTCGSNGSWGELPVCLREPATPSGYLLSWNSALIAIGVVIWLIAVALDIVGLVVLIILAREKFNANFRFWHGLFILLLLLTALFLVISAALWIALGVNVGNYNVDREADISYFSKKRDDVCISAFVLSLAAAFSVAVVLLLPGLMPKVLSSKGSADITQSDLGDEIPVKNTEETPINGESGSTCHYNSLEGYRKEMEKDKSDGDSVLEPAPLEQPPSKNWTSGEDALNELELQPFPADTVVLEAEGHEKENDMVTKVDLSVNLHH